MKPEDEVQAELERRNFTRAATLAADARLGDEVIRSAREKAFKQALGEWFNFRSAEKMARDWEYTRDDVVRLCDEIIAEFRAREEKSGREVKVFDISRMDHAPVIKLVAQFRDRFR